jgi:outer membrane protein assembly factor BamD
MKDLSDDTMRVFKTNFPDSEIFKTGKRVSVTAREKSWWQIWNVTQ